MRAQILAAWQNEVQRAVAERLPGFSLRKTKVRFDPPGLLRFEWHARAKLWCIVAFRPLDSEGFDITVGWATEGDAPSTLAPGADEGDFAAARFFELPLRIRGGSGMAYWNFWEPSEAAVDDPALFAQEYSQHFLSRLSDADARRLVSPAIEAAIDEFGEYCLPYLELRIAHEDAMSV